ncbi:MAG TPA: NADH-quinone oxidoreductase subunit C [Anaeromyxobacteraceae bacterium]|nr:NADH-quinone oxidoreductase subunit C [Anaeromyxobacteraceae bacterium]
MTAAALRESTGGSWTERPDGWWRPTAPGEVRAAARALRDGGARFAALVVSAPRPGALRLTWHFDLGGTLLTLDAAAAPDARVPSIADVYPGADWAEREARDHYAVAFEGRAATPPLVLRDGDAPGVMAGAGGPP